ncbi:MAG: hypothetical protein J4F99_02090 [Acidimicrobiia bacterium]|nr:hypothetical protein [Acidimicrobiia bacterium]
MSANAIFAHQGGWDEILIIIGPLAVIVWVVALVRHRMRRETDAGAEVDAEAGSGVDAPAS